MKKCINCGKESDGNFCNSCGGILKEDDEIIEKIEETLNVVMEENYKKIKSKLNNTFLYLFIISILVIIGMGTYFTYRYTEQKYKITTLNTQIDILQNENINYKEKAEFLDANIVFVLKGYGNYYYTYDQVMQVTQGEGASFRAYSENVAIEEGYIAWE